MKGIEMDEQGIIPSALDAACRQFQARFIYLTPTLQNPTTATMSLQRREAVLAICKKHGLIIIEDDVNGLLPNNPPPAMVNLAPEQVIYIGAVSKCLAPGLRVGYVQAPEKLYQQLSITLQNHSWMISPLLTAITCQLIASKKIDQALTIIRTEMSQRLSCALEYLAPYNPAYEKDCFHFWLPLPDYWRLSDFIQQAEQQGVMVKSAELFTPPAGNVPPAVRLALSSPFDLAQLEKGIRQLKALLDTKPMCDFAL
jgi:DNA-binding transcriptional MocR family regulator